MVLRKTLLTLFLILLFLPVPSWAVVSVVNQVIASTTGAASLTTGTFSATAGNTLVVLACSKSDTSLLITTSGSDTPTSIDVGNSTPRPAALRLIAFYNISGGASYTISVEPGGGTPTLTLIVMELGSVPTSAVFDVASVANITPANTSHASGSTATLAQADEIAIGYLCSDSDVAATTTQDTGYTLSNSETAGGTKSVGALSYKIVSATTAVSHAWTTDSTTSRTGVATFKAAAAGGATPRNLTLMGVGQ